MKEISGEWPFFCVVGYLLQEIENKKFVYLQNLYESVIEVYEIYTTRRILWKNSIMTLSEELR